KPTQDTYEEWQSGTRNHLSDCLSFYDTHSDSPLRWDAIASAHFTCWHYHEIRRGIASGGLKWFPKGTELDEQAICDAARPAPRAPVGTFQAPRVATRQEALEYEEQVRTALMKDPVLNCAEWARVLLIADWALDSEPADLDRGVYAALA